MEFMDSMNRKVASLHRLEGFSEIKQNLEYWLSRPASERLEAVQILRRQAYGDTGRIKKVVKIICNGIK
jgi:hypothetical protein